MSNKFTNLHDVFMDPMRFPCWPFFMPDVVQDRESPT